MNNEQSSLLVNEDAEYGSFQTELAKSSTSVRKRGLSSRWRYSLAGFVIAIIATLAFVGTSVLLMIPKAQDYVNQSVEMNVQNVELDSITTKGVNVRVTGVNSIDYGAIESGYASRLFKIVGGLLRSADVSIDSVELQTVMELDGEEKVVTIGSILVPDFTVNIGNGEITTLDLLVSIHPNTAKILGLIKDLLQHPEKVFKISGSTVVNLGLAGLLPIRGIGVNFEQEIVGNKYFHFRGDQMQLNDLSVSEINGAYDIAFELSVLNPILHKMIAFEVPTLSWQLFTNDCFENPTISMFDHEVTTKGFKFSANDEFVNVDIKTSLSQLNPALFDHCSLDDPNLTPMSVLIDQILKNESLPVMIKNSKGSSKYPGFVNEILHSLEFNIDYYSSLNISQLLESVSLSNFKFQFQNGNINKPVIDGEIHLVINLPLNSSESNLENLRISKIRGSRAIDDTSLPIKLSHENEGFGEVSFKEWHDCENVLEEDKLHVKLVLSQEELTIMNKSKFGQVVNEVLKNGKSQVFIEATMDCLVDTLIGEFQINSLKAKSESEISRSNVF